MQSADLYIAMFLIMAAGFGALAIWARRKSRAEEKRYPTPLATRRLKSSAIRRARYYR